MPARVTMTLRPDRPPHRPTPEPPTWNQIHGLCCALIGETSEEHDPRGTTKPWTVSLTPAGTDLLLQLRLNLLDDTRTGIPAPPPQVRLGAVNYHVDQVEQAQAPATGFLITPLARAVRMRHLTPTTLTLPSPTRADGTRGPRRYLPLPEPVAIYRGLGRRWNTFSAHAGHRIPDDLLAAILEHVVVAEHEITTELAQVGQGSRPGFLGEVVYTLADRDTAHPAVLQAFTTLSAYAAYSGVGSQTTHGLGAVDVTFADG